MTWLSESLSFLVHMTLFALCTVVVPIIVSFIWHWLEETCARRQLFSATGAALLAFAIALMPTIAKRTGTTGDPSAIATQEHDPLSDWDSRHPGGGVRSGESDATLRFESIDVHSNDTATLRLAWPLDLIPTNTTIDLLVATSLVNSAWTWQCGHAVGEDDTNWTVTVALPETSPGTAAPSAFYRAVHRETCADTMDDFDGDGIPGAYELAHGTNPYVADAEDVPRLTVGADGQYATIQAALAASAPYSVVSLASGDYRVSESVRMPSQPVMVTCEDGYAVFSGATPTGIFMLADGHESGHTLFRNLYLNLASKSGMQAGFWCGGGLPWMIPGAAAVFENVHIRAPNPGVEYFGWLFYGHCEAPAVIRGCCVNASGAEWMFGVLGDNPPPLALESCTFVNFPTQAAQRTSVAVGLRSLRLGGSPGFTPTVTVSRVLFDASFTNAWPMARFENAFGFHVTMADCIRPSEPASSAFAPNVTANVHVVTSQVAWAGFPLAGSPAAMLGIGAFRPIPSGSSDDTDRDTLADYEETYGRGLDPFLADTDGDGADDGEEIRDGTDPSDPDSFLQRLTVTATNTASLAFPVRVAWGHSQTGWEANGLAVFASGFGEKAYTNAASQATTYMKAFCDMNLDGEYGADDDILIVRTIPHVGTARFDFVFGDVDHDGLSDYDEMHSHGTDPLRADTDGDGMRDGEEISGGTDPTNRHSFVQTQYVSVTNTASLAHAVYLAWGYSATGWESNGLASFPQGFGTNAYETASPQGAVYIKAFCDLNDNGEYDAADDIMAVRQIPFGREAHFRIAFGDVDGDGVPDTQERQDGTDPDDANSFRLRAKFRFTDHDAGHGCTNLVAVSLTETEWDPVEVVKSSTDKTFVYTVNTNVTHGAVYVKCLHDRDGDGLLDVGSEGIRTIRLSYSVRDDTFVEVSIGDYDYDGVCDTQELLDGTDPFDDRNYCFNLSLTYTGVFQTTNALTFSASFGTNRVYGPCVVEGDVWSNNFGHLSTDTREHVSVDVWDDANSSGEWDVGETSNRYAIAVTGHDMAVTNELSYKNFDGNGNEIPDWWEVQTGLDAEGVARRAYDDPDGDGLINLHEFWCGTNPFFPDGANTFLSVASRSIDDRISGIDPAIAIPRFVNYFVNGSNNVFIANTEFWARDLDLSCVSVWHNGVHKGTKAATLITRKHVVLADHWYNGGTYTFCGTNGQICVRSLLRSYPISDDLRLGCLDEALPECFKPAHVPSTNIVRYLVTGKYLPTLCLNQEKGASVTELVALDSDTTSDRGIHYLHYGCTSHTNLVSAQRCNVRGATVDGNSGCPVFVVAGNDLVLLFSKHLGQKGGETWKRYWGPVLPFRLEVIQRKIDEWEGADASQYQIAPFDFSSFREIINQR